MQDKINFVKDLAAVLTYQGNIPSINSIEYEIYKNKSGGNYEYLRVNYFGGGYAVRCCTGDSLSAIYRELGKLLDGGYYDEVQYYEEYIVNNPDLERYTKF